MDGKKFSYAGIAGSVAGIVGLLGVYSSWWETDTHLYHGIADASGRLVLAMSFALFAFGGAYVLLSDAGIRRAMGALLSLCAVVLTLGCVWGLTRTDQIAAGAKVGSGMWVSLLAGLVGIAAGLVALRSAMAADQEAVAPPSADA
jgi:hypothetical protein